MRYRVSCLAMMALAVIGIAVRGMAVDLYVATNASPTSPYATWATGFTGIQDALDYANAGDTIHVAGHTFKITTPLAWSNSQLVLRGGYAATNGTSKESDYSRFPTLIRPATGVQTRLLTVQAVADIAIEGLEFHDGRSPGHGGGIWMANVTNLTMASVKLIGNRSAPAFYGGGMYLDQVTGVISNAMLLGNASLHSAPGDRQWGGGLYLAGAQSALLFRDLVVVGNRATHAYNADSRGGGGYIAAGNHLFRNLLLANNLAHSSGGGIHRAGGTVTLYNATLTGNAPEAVYGAGTVYDSIVSGNVLDLNAAAAPALYHTLVGDGRAPDANGNFSADPGFVWPLPYLGATSPALSAGGRTAFEAGVVDRTVFTHGAVYDDPEHQAVHLGYHHAAGLPVIEIELYVNPDPLIGDDGNDGTADLPLRTITHAVRQVGYGQTARVHLAPGIYTNTVESFPLTIAGRTIQFAGADAATTILDAGNSPVQLFRFERAWGDNRIENLTLRRVYYNDTAAKYGGGIYAAFSALTLDDCRLNNHYLGSAGGNGAALFAQCSSGWARNTRFVQNQARQYAGMVGGAVYLAGGAWRFDRTVFDGNTAERQNHNNSTAHGGGIAVTRAVVSIRSGLFIRNWARGDGSAISAESSRVEIDNGTFATNAGFAAHTYLHSGGSATVRNTIFWDNLNSADFNMAAGNFTHSCAAALTSGTGNISVAPLFVDPDRLDFRLQRDVSPCIDAGINRDWMTGALDLGGLPRVLYGARSKTVDMGAYETPPLPGSVMALR